jgi:hypothetical protein
MNGRLGTAVRIGGIVAGRVSAPIGTIRKFGPSAMNIGEHIGQAMANSPRLVNYAVHGLQTHPTANRAFNTALNGVNRAYPYINKFLGRK